MQAADANEGVAGSRGNNDGALKEKQMAGFQSSNY